MKSLSDLIQIIPHIMTTDHTQNCYLNYIDENA